MFADLAHFNKCAIQVVDLWWTQIVTRDCIGVSNVLWFLFFAQIRFIISNIKNFTQ
jgi:hypothetical protein